MRINLPPFMEHEIQSMVPAFGETRQKVVLFILRSWLSQNAGSIGAQIKRVAELTAKETIIK
jgi:hypothetical protein